MTGTPPPGARARVLTLGPLSLLWYPRAVAVTVVLVLLALGLGLLALMTGTTHLDAGDVIDGLRGGPAEVVVRELRLPRVLLALVVGACLGLAGSVFQSLSRNALGSPDIIGVTTGAALGAVVAIVLLGLGPGGAALGALIGCLVVSALTYALSRTGGRDPGRRLVLVGIGIGAFCHGVVALILTHANPDASIMGQVWLTGSLNARTWPDLMPATAALVVLGPVLTVQARRLTLLEAGDDLAAALGVALQRTRAVTVLAGVALTAMAVCSIGPVSFVALAAPHLARATVRTATVPVTTAAATGAVLLLASDLAAQRMPELLRVPVGVATGVLGGLYLVLVLARRS